MHRRDVRTWTLLAVLAIATWWASADGLFAQQAAPQTAAPQLDIYAGASIDDPIEQLLLKGRTLETDQRWAEALLHYEDALRQYPDDSKLLRRHDSAKLHYGLQRRYGDSSFLNSIRTLENGHALGLFTELLLKIDSHYVTTPPWRELVRRGTDGLSIALAEPSFRHANGLNAGDGHVEAFRRQLPILVQRYIINNRHDAANVVAEVARVANQRLGLRPAATILEYVAAAAGGLDNYSAYLSADQLRDVYSQIEGNFVGLGVELKADAGSLLIVHVIPGSPAEQAGLLDGDRIVAIEGKPTDELSTDQAASRLTGEEGSVVTITVSTPGRADRDLSIRRAHVEVPSLEDVHLIDEESGIAYARIPAFQKSTSKDLDDALWDLHRRGMKSLILDVRGNPGGLLSAAVEVADRFISGGYIVSTRGRNPEEQFDYRAHRIGTWRVPLVVLIDAESASASEIFAGAIRDGRRGLLVGERSFGKGSVQGIFPLGYAGAGVRLTTAKFYSPSGRAISKVGVTPDIVPRRAAKATDGHSLPRRQPANDTVLEAGIRAARDQTATR